MDRPIPTEGFKLPSSSTTIPETGPAKVSDEEYKQTDYYAPHQRRSMDQSRPRRSLSNGELENLDKPQYPVCCYGLLLCVSKHSEKWLLLLTS